MKTNLFMSAMYLSLAFLWKYIVTAPSEADILAVYLFVFLGLYRLKQALAKV